VTTLGATNNVSTLQYTELCWPYILPFDHQHKANFQLQNGWSFNSRSSSLGTNHRSATAIKIEYHSPMG